jgi:tungstate transport system substrate-binding protein
MRRRLLLGSLWATPIAALAQRPDARANPLRFGADHALVDSGLAGALQRGFGRDTGILVQVVPGPALAILEAVGNGELDAALANAPEAETRLLDQGLVHDRRAIARGQFVIVGPARPAAARGDRAPTADSAASVLRTLHDGAAAAPNGGTFVSANDGSGTHLAEQAAWRLAKAAPQPPWYRPLATGERLIAAARAGGAHGVVEQGAWRALGGSPLVVLVARDPALAEAVHAMRSFRSPHGAGALFLRWISGPRGRAIVAGHGSYQLPVA